MVSASALASPCLAPTGFAFVSLAAGAPGPESGLEVAFLWWHRDPGDEADAVPEAEGSLVGP